jgi:Family of unknown function (DUF6925)
MQGTEPAVTIALLQEMLAEVGAGWNIGTFGALAEFHHVAQDPAPMITLTRTGGDAVTARGAIHVALAADVLPVAYEGLANDPQAWTHALSFCLREEFAGMGRHSVLTELGADHDALREIDRDAILFDIGIGAPHIDFYVRTDDAALIAVLRQAAGQSILQPRHPAMAAIVATSPHRVCISRLGRVEVYQPIPSGPGARSPIGPHTHLLPQLLRHGRSHSANAPTPMAGCPPSTCTRRVRSQAPLVVRDPSMPAPIPPSRCCCGHTRPPVSWRKRTGSCERCWPARSRRTILLP